MYCRFPVINKITYRKQWCIESTVIPVRGTARFENNRYIYISIEKAGFKNVFIQWYNKNWNPTQEEQLKYIRKKDLNVIFAQNFDTGLVFVSPFILRVIHFL